MIRLARADDPALVPYQRVGDHEWLAGQGLFVAEGRLVVERLLAADRFGIESIVVTPAAAEALGAGLAAADADVLVVERGILQGITGFNFHRGCLALARRPAPLPSGALRGGNRLVALEGVGNPDNVGGIFRTAAALGADGVLLDPTSGDPLYRKAMRTSMAATLRLPWIRHDRWREAIQRYRADGFTIVALTPASSAMPLSEYAATRPARCILLLGGEGFGLGADALEGADALVRIPMADGVDSLNVVVALGIALERLR